LPDLFVKLNKILESPVITTHIAKVEAAKVHKLLAQRLHTAADVVIGYYWPAANKALDSAMKDRVLKVQNAANEAKKAWEDLRKSYLEMESKKMTEERPKTAVTKTNLANKYREARKAAKEHKLTVDNADILSENQKKMEQISAIWGSAARAAKYLRKRDGCGGGNVSQGIVRKSRSKDNDPAVLNNEKIIREMLDEDEIEKNNAKNLENKPKSEERKTGITAQEFVLSRKKEYESRRKQEECKAKNNNDSLEEIPREDLQNLESPLKNEKKQLNNFLEPPKESPGIDRQSDDPDIDKVSESSIAQNIRSPQITSNQEIQQKTKDDSDANLMEGLKKAHIHPPQPIQSNIKKEIPAKPQNPTNIQPNLTNIQQNKPFVVPTKESRQQIERNLQNYDSEPLRDTVDLSKMPGKQEEQIPVTTAQWIEASKKLAAGRVEESYRTVLNSEDDLYLLRIMMQTGPITKTLTTGTTEVVLRRINQIVRANCIPSILLNWIKESVEKGDFMGFEKKLQNELLDTLYELRESKTELGETASEIYKKAIISMKEQKNI